MSRFEDALACLRSGGAVLLADEEREASAFLVTASSSARPEALSSLVKHGQGPVSIIGADQARSQADSPLVHDVVSADRADEINAFKTIEHDVIEKPVPTFWHHALDPSISNGRVAAISAALEAIAGRHALPEVVAVSTDRHGVLAHHGAVEGAADLVRLAEIGSSALLRAIALPGGVLAPSGSAMRVAKRHGFPFVAIQDIIAHRLRTETIVEEIAMAHLPTRYAARPFEVRAFRSLIDGSEHLALIQRPENHTGSGPEPLVRLHSECLTGDALGSLRCDCGEQLRSALQQIDEDPQGGVVIYLRGQEGRGIGLANKIRAYALQEQGFDTVDANLALGFPADLRDYGVAIQILRALGIERLRLLSNNPQKQAALERYGIVVAERHGLRIGSNPYNAAYLETKRVKMGHDLATGSRINAEENGSGTASAPRG